jgi:DHA2 family multidrug resistance protein
MRAELVASLNRPDRALFLMERHGLDAARARTALDGMVERQAVMVATNHLFLLVGVIVAAAACAIWLMPKPPRVLAVAAGH